VVMKYMRDRPIFWGGKEGQIGNKDIWTLTLPFKKRKVTEYKSRATFLFVREERRIGKRGRRRVGPKWYLRNAQQHIE